MQPKKIALLARDLSLDKKAENPVILDISKLTSVANYFVVTHGHSQPQVRAIAEHIMEQFKQKKERAWHVEGLQALQWVLIDFSSVIVHVFHKDMRDFYALERLWGEAPRL